MTNPARRCSEAVNSFHSILYFAPDLDAELATRGIGDPTEAYLAGRAAPLGAVGPGTVAAAFNAFAVPLIREHIPAVWEKVTPDEAIAARTRAADAVLERLLGIEVLNSPELAQAATLANRAAQACSRPGRPMYSANADLDAPERPHLALWHASTLLREYRGDAHVIALGYAELSGLEALVTHCASPAGMPKELVMSKRGWSEMDWSAAERRLVERALMDETGALTTEGIRLREDIEHETDRLDRSPYEYLGPERTRRLTRLAGQFVGLAADADAFPAILRDFFVPAA
ncbi:MAG TPA: hypothetical protein VJT49_19860 [Amycolatopsis sp.]|uniref:SCO6745 family protein n=1 Tax=Amycolatopsis sp. TaxID=37632 RepID=UPI002B46F607|nr:hypothetical protein [Amycolatopsis sp.]HKS47321.1 hypothetical protein [Amycolatopsis sp.]